MPKISVIVPIYNVEDYLGYCVDSVLNQTFSDFELILVDDGSPDNCPAMCDEYAKQDSRVIVIHKKNGGLSDARNAGLKIAKGEYIYFLDGDDYIDSELLEKTLQAMLSNNADMVTFNFYSITDDNFIEAYSLWHEFGTFDISDERAKLDFIFQKFFKGSTGWEAWGRLYKSDIIKKFNIYFEDNRKIFAEDLYFCLCYIAHSKKIVSLEDWLYFYRIRSSSIMAENNKKVNLERMNKLFEAVKKHYDMHLDCKFIKDYYPLLYFYIIENDLRKAVINKNLNVVQRRELLIEEIANFKKIKKYFGELKKFKTELSCVYGGLKAQEIINVYSFFCNGNYMLLLLKNKLLYKKKNKFKIIDEEKYKDFSCKNRKVYYLCSEEYGNIGDHKINDATVAFLEALGYNVFEITLAQYYSNIHLLEKYIKKEDLIVLPGGGNITDVYVFAEKGKHDVIERWRDNKKIIFPQTVFYTDTEKGRKAKESARRIYTAENNVILFTRESVSYNYSRELFNCDVLFVPDIVLSQNECDNSIRNEIVLLCLRSDIEGILSNSEKDLIVNNIKSRGLNIEYTDLQMKADLKANQRKSIISVYMNLWKSSRLVITDRLHGMIFAAITGTPCIALSNYNQKIKGTYELISHLPYIKYANNVDEAISFIPELLKMENCKYDKTPLDVYFKKLADEIKNELI